MGNLAAWLRVGKFITGKIGDLSVSYGIETCENEVFFIATLRGEEQWLMVTGIEMIVATTVTQSWILILISTSLIMIIFIHLNIDLSLIMDDIFILDIKINNQ